MNLTAEYLADGRGQLIWNGRSIACSFGRSGVVRAVDKREGDGATPLGAWALRRVLYRSDRLDQPDTALPVRSIKPNDGWCDAPADRAYNRPVRLPYPANHEVMTRDDNLYDVVVILGHNDDPPMAGAGSAIFLHCAKRPDGSMAEADDPHPYNVTEGCIAVARPDLLEILRHSQRGDVMIVSDGRATATSL